MISRNGSYIKTPDVVLKTFEEWGRAYAYTPDDPEIYDLNTTAWLIVELCDGRPFSQIEADFVREVGPKIGDDLARYQFHDGFNHLIAKNIISASEF